MSGLPPPEIPGYVAGPTEARLLAAIDTAPAITDLRRLAQQYGYRYDYKARRLDARYAARLLPLWRTPDGLGQCASRVMLALSLRD